MKTISLMTLASIIAFGACSSEVIESTTEEANHKIPINFAPDYISNASRGIDSMTLDEMKRTNFGVFGTFSFPDSSVEVSHFNNRISYSEQTSRWNDSEPRFWDKSKKYNFIAYAPYAKTGIVNFNKEGLGNFYFQLPICRKKSKATDIIVSYPVRSVSFSENFEVPLYFNHILSKINFSVIKNEAYSTPIEIRKVILGLPDTSSSHAVYLHDLKNIAGTTTSSFTMRSIEQAYPDYTFDFSTSPKKLVAYQPLPLETYFVAPFNDQQKDSIHIKTYVEYIAKYFGNNMVANDTIRQTVDIPLNLQPNTVYNVYVQIKYRQIMFRVGAISGWFETDKITNYI